MAKKIAMIIAFKDFRDEELFIPKSIFEKEGIEVKVVSTQKGKAIGSYGGVIDVELTLDEIDVSDFNGIVFVGGQGAVNYINEEKCHQIAKKALEQEKVLAAICIAPAILAESGVLKGKKATVWSSPLDKSAIKILEKNGARYEKLPVVVDRKIVTANGPQSARKFAQEIIKILC